MVRTQTLRYIAKKTLRTLPEEFTNICECFISGTFVKALYGTTITTVYTHCLCIPHVFVSQSNHKAQLMCVNQPNQDSFICTYMHQPAYIRTYGEFPMTFPMNTCDNTCNNTSQTMKLTILEITSHKFPNQLNFRKSLPDVISRSILKALRKKCKVFFFLLNLSVRHPFAVKCLLSCYKHLQ